MKRKLPYFTLSFVVVTVLLLVGWEMAPADIQRDVLQEISRSCDSYSARDWSRIECKCIGVKVDEPGYHDGYGTRCIGQVTDRERIAGR